MPLSKPVRILSCHSFAPGENASYCKSLCPPSFTFDFAARAGNQEKNDVTSAAQRPRRGLVERLRWNHGCGPRAPRRESPLFYGGGGCRGDFVWCPFFDAHH